MRREEPDSERTCFERDQWTGSCYVVDGPWSDHRGGVRASRRGVRASVSKDTISDKVLEEMAEWLHRPLDVVYPVVFIDAIVVKVKDGQVSGWPTVRV